MPTTLVSLRIDNELLEYLKQRAEKEHRTLSNMIVSILINERWTRNQIEYLDSMKTPLLKLKRENILE